MKWLPARAYDNAIYAIFSNPIGMDDDQLKNGCPMIIDPFGDVIAECRSFDNEIAMATLTPQKLTGAGGYRYIKPAGRSFTAILSRSRISWNRRWFG